MPDRLVWRVLPDHDYPGWKVELPDGKDAKGWTMKADAIAFARKQGEAADGLVIVYDAAGQIMSETEYP